MRPVSLTIVGVIAFFCGKAQNQSSIFKIDNNYLSRKSFTVFANRTFGQIATGQNTASLSNFGSFEPLKGSFTFNAFTPVSFRTESTGHIPYLSLEVKGDLASDNIGVLFSNSQLNTNVDATIKFHYPIPYFFRIGFLGSDYQNLLNKKIRLQKQYDLKLAMADTLFERTAFEKRKIDWQLNSVHLQLSRKRDTMRQYNDSINNELVFARPDTLKIAKFTKEHMEIDSQIRRLSIDSLQLENVMDSLENIIRLPSDKRRNAIRIIKRDLRKEFEDTLQKLELTAPITRVRLLWASAVGSFNKKKYYHYFEKLPFDKQISNNDFSAFNLGGELNYYSQRIRSQNAHFFTLGIKHIKDNNIKDLSTSEVNQTTTTVDGSTEREIVKKYSAYTDTITEYKSWFVYGSYYFIFKRSALSAIHFFPELDIRNTHKNYLNLGIGYVISVKDSKKEKSVLNAEAYFKFVDIDDQNGTAKRFYDRNEIGIKIGVPLNFAIN